MALFLSRIIKARTGKDLPIVPVPFTDLSGLSTHSIEAIQRMYGAGIMKGISATTFDSARNVTREQMASYFHRSACLDSSSNADESDDETVTGSGNTSSGTETPVTKSGSTFEFAVDDVSCDNEFRPYVYALAQSGLVDQSGSFRPEDKITVGEFSRML